MSELRKIVICQSDACQGRGSKNVLHRLQSLYADKGKGLYPNLLILTEDNCGDCEQGPIVHVNDSTVLRRVDTAMIEELFKDPEAVLGSVMHVLAEDRQTFDRIVGGDLF